MSKIAAFQTAKGIANRVRENLMKARGLDRSSNDKHRLEVTFTGDLDHNNWSAARLRLTASYGYYGSSSGYVAMDEHTAKYMAAAINVHINAIAETAIKLADVDAEKARLAAEAEAKAVLTAVSPS